MKISSKNIYLPAGQPRHKTTECFTSYPTTAYSHSVQNQWVIWSLQQRQESTSVNNTPCTPFKVHVFSFWSWNKNYKFCSYYFSLLCCWDSPTWSPMLVCSIDGIPPIRRWQHKHSPMRPLLISARVVETLGCGFHPSSESLLYYWDFSHSEPLMFACSDDGCYLHSETQTSAYRLPSSDPQANKPLAVSLCQCHSADGIPFTRSPRLPLRWWDSLHSESQIATPLMGSTHTWRPRVQSANGFHPDSKTMSPIHWWDFPHSEIANPIQWWVSPPLGI